LRRWNIDRVTVFLSIAAVSFLYDLTLILGIRDPTRFPHPFFYIRSLDDLEYLRGFTRMLRQAMFSLVAGGLLGWGVSLAVFKNSRLILAAIGFLRVAMWIPFLVVFAVHDTFWLGIAATALAGLYHYLMPRTYLGLSASNAFPMVAGEVAFQALFFTFFGQVWLRRWDWLIFPVNNDMRAGFFILAVVVALVLLVKIIFRRSFLAGCEIRIEVRIKELPLAHGDSLRDMTLLTVGWLFV